MLRDRIEAKWIEAFAHTFELCAVKPGDDVLVLSETQSRQINVHLAELALLQMGAKPFHVVIPTRPQTAPAAVRSTGSSDALGEGGPVVELMTKVPFVADLTVEGAIHTEHTPRILGSGTRMLYISNEHPEALERLRADPDMKRRIMAGRALMDGAEQMHVTSKAGTDLTVDMREAMVGGNVGWVDEPSKLASWPGGICSCFPRAKAVNGTLVLDRGDINLTFKQYLREPITLIIEDDFATEVRGEGVDADLMRSYFAVWNDREAYGASHVGWGMNHGARWDSLAMYDKGDINGTELRAFAGNFLYSTGANPRAGRYTLGHYDIPVRGCTIRLDGETVVDEGRLVDALN